VMRDDDNCVRHERVYGTFRLEWKTVKRPFFSGGTVELGSNGMFRFKDWNDHG
jgi:hypothetical protein